MIMSLSLSLTSWNGVFVCVTLSWQPISYIIRIRNDILQEVRCWSGQFVFIFPSQKSPNLNCGRSILFPWPRPTLRQLVEPGDWWEPSRDTADTGDQTRPGQTTDHNTELRPPGLSGWSDRGSSQFSSSPVWLSPHWRTLWRWDLSQNHQYH